MYHSNQSVYLLPSETGSGEFKRLHSIGIKGYAAVALFAITTVVYFWYRLPLWNPTSPVISGLLLWAECFGVLTLALHVFSTWTLVERRVPRPPEQFEADIFITTWNESPELLRKTVLAAKQVRLARHIWLLDDGCRPTMEQLSHELGIRYIARADRSHAKAGNLNNALDHSDAEFIALFDCDHAPSPEFLERTLGHFVDPSVAFVQTPQDFYNIDSFQHRGSAATQEVWHEQTLFYRVIQAGKDRWNAAFFCGSCAVLRRAALDDIGGFATGTITEDMHTSLRMHKKGWSATYHAEALAFGLSPVNFEQYETQRLRWGRGAMQVWAKEGILFARGLTLAQRLAYFTSVITYFEGWQKAIIYFLPAVVLLTGSMPLIWTGWPFVLIFALWLLSGLLVNEVFSRGYAKTAWMEEYNFLRFFTFMRATTTMVIPRSWRFFVTPKSMENNSRDMIRLWPQITVVACAVVSGIIGSYLFWTTNHLPEGAFAANLFWLTLNTILALRALGFVLSKTRQRRGDHRFRIPIVARVSLGAEGDCEKFTAITEDISSEGISLAVERKVPEHSEISGVLLLPAGPASFSGAVQRIRHVDGQGSVIAVKVKWSNPDQAAALNSLLYGNTLQWDINDWAEISKLTWVQMFLRLIGRRPQPGSWRFAQLIAAGKVVDCVARTEGKTVRLLSSVSLPSKCDLTLARMDGSEQTGLQVVGYREYTVGGAPVHLAVLAREQKNSITFHREPSWAHG